MTTDLRAAELYIPPEIEPGDAAVFNAVYTRRPAIDTTLGGLRAQIGPAWAPPDERGPERSSITLTIDTMRARLTLDTALAQALLSTAGEGLSLMRLAPAHAGLLLEFALKDALMRLEGAAKTRLSVLDVDGEVQPIPDSVSLRFALAVEGFGTSWAWLTLPRRLASRLAALLSSLRMPRAAVLDASLPVALRTGHVMLALSQLQGLAPGDIILAEESCPPETAAAVIAEHLTAPVELTADGARLVAAPSPLARSSLAWSGGPPQIADGRFEGAAEGIPVRIFFELGRHSITVSELGHLAPGMMIAAPREDRLLDIVAGGRRIGRGEPVSIGQGRGLRVAQLTADE